MSQSDLLALRLMYEEKRESLRRLWLAVCILGAIDVLILWRLFT